MATTPPETRTLSSWKEIAAYLGKGVRTVQRWEQQLGLPVRRPDSLSRGVVVATSAELDRWLRSKWALRLGVQTNGNTGDGGVRDRIQASRALRLANREIVDEVLRNVQSLRSECEVLARSTARTIDTKRTRKT